MGLKLMVELRNTLFMQTVENNDFLEELMAIFKFEKISACQIRFDPGPIDITVADLSDLHELVSLLGACTIRATEEGFYILVGD